MRKCFLAAILVLYHLLPGVCQVDSVTNKRISDKMNRNASNYMDTTLYSYTLRPITITSLRVFAKAKDQKRYDRLVYHVKKVYPYAHRAGILLREEEVKMQGMDRGDRKAHMKQVEKDLERQFGPELKELTFTQGRILLKLIDRETGHTSYQLVDDLRGSFRAWFYDGVAGLFGYDLKGKFDPENNAEDRYIDELVRMIEAGLL